MRSKKQFYLLLGIILFSSIGTAMPAPILAPFFLMGGGHALSSHHLNLLFGLTLAVYPLGEVIGAPVIGRLSDQYGAKKLLYFTLSGSCLGYVLSGIAISVGSLSLLIITRFITGLAESNYTIAQALIIETTEDKKKDLGMLALVSSTGWVVGPLMGGVLASQQLVQWFGYSLPFYFAGLLSLFLLYCTHSFLRLTKKRSERMQQSWVSQINLIKNFMKLTKNRYIKWCLICNFLLTFSMTTYYEFYPALLTKVWQMDATQISVLTSLLSLSIGIGAIYLSRLMAYLMSQTVAHSLLLGVMIVGYVLFISTIKTDVYISFIILGLAYGALFNLLIVLLSDATDSKSQGETLGFRMSLIKLGNSVMCIAGGFLIMISIRLPIIVAICLCVINFGCLFFVREVRVKLV